MVVSPLPPVCHVIALLCGALQRIGIRELRQHASRYLALVSRGEQFEVTDRGRPVALLVPVRRQAWDDLIASQRLTLPSDETDIVDDEPRDYGVDASRRAPRDARNQRVRLYLDSSALVKLVQRELESAALREFLRQYRQDERVASELARVEVVRSVLAGGPSAVTHARRQLARLYLMAVDRDVLNRAATLAPASLVRSLDAIHLSSAQLLGAELRAVVTSDVRMAQAAASLGMTVESPH